MVMASRHRVSHAPDSILETYSVVTASTIPVLGSQNLIRLSLLPNTRKPLVSCHSMPSVIGQNTFFPTLRERPDAHGGVVTGTGRGLVVWRETERGPCGEVIHVRLEVLDDVGLVRGCDVGARAQKVSTWVVASCARRMVS